MTRKNIMSSDRRWEVNNSTESDIVKKIEDLLNKATQTVHSVEYTRIVVTVILAILVGMILIEAYRKLTARY